MCGVDADKEWDGDSSAVGGEELVLAVLEIVVKAAAVELLNARAGMGSKKSKFKKAKTAKASSPKKKAAAKKKTA